MIRRFDSEKAAETYRIPGTVIIIPIRIPLHGCARFPGSSVSIDPREHPYLDHGYAVTSHSSQGQTADRVLINIATELAAKDLINNRMAYVSISRGAHDAQIFTSDREKLPEALSRDVSHQSAHVPEIAKSCRAAD